MGLPEIVAELIAVPIDDPIRWATDGERLGRLWSQLTEQAEGVLTQFAAESFCVAQAWDHRVDCLVQLRDGPIAGEMVSLGDLTEQRLQETGERLRRKAAGEEVKLLNPIWMPIGIAPSSQA